jgi:hypothetical protein
MRKDKEEKEKQLPLEIEYKGNKTFERLHYKSSKLFIILDQFAFWRSPLLWLLIFVNIGLAYGFMHLYLSIEAPPAVPLLYYLSDDKDIPVPALSLPLFLLVHSVLQCTGVYVSARMYYKLKQYSRFIMLASILVTLLFYATMFKSLTLTLPSS